MSTLRSGEAPAEASASRTQKLSSSLQTAKHSANYLFDPKAAPPPDRRRTRVFLRTARYVGIFLFWRIVRSLKYAAVGAITAALASTAIGTVTGGIGFVLAPPGILGGAGVGLLWAFGKFGWRTLARRVRKGDVDGADARGDEKLERGEVPVRDEFSEDRAKMRVQPW